MDAVSPDGRDEAPAPPRTDSGGAAPARPAPTPAPRPAASSASGAPRSGERRLRLLLLTTELLPAGAERIVYELATRLPRARWQVEVASLRNRTPPGGRGGGSNADGGPVAGAGAGDPAGGHDGAGSAKDAGSAEDEDGAVARDLRRAGIEVTPLRLRGKADPLGALRLLTALRRFRPDVLHAHLFHANLAARLLGRVGGARRVISTVHVVERRRLRARALLERLTAARDDATVCVSQAVAAHAVEALGAAPARTRVIENGIDLSAYEPHDDPAGDSAAAATAAARAALGIPAGAAVVGAVGRLSAQKGLPVLIEAFARIAARRPDALLVLAGAGEEEGALRQLVRTRGLSERVRFLGFRPDVPRVLAALDVFCMPSRWEGFGLAAVEALAAGRPVVASAIDSLPEVVGDAGVLVPPGRADALARAVLDLLDDPLARAELARRGPARAARFEVGRMVAAYEALYLELLAVRG